jgi:uncharacterized membrane-anchored protein
MDNERTNEELPVDANDFIKLSIEDIELSFRQEELDSNKQDREERKRYAFYIFLFLCSFLFITLAIVILTAIKLFFLSDTVLITLLSTTSADIIGVFIIVVKYLFKAKL